MPENSNQVDQQQRPNTTNPGQGDPPAGKQNEPIDTPKKAPGYNEIPNDRNRGETGETNQQDPAWRPGDDPAGTTQQPATSADDVENARSRGTQAGGGGY
ncbi:MAG: hypothetical protein ACKVQW_03780 [Pyrinomonadaceae bacterium]